jgi:shikimate kinase
MNRLPNVFLIGPSGAGKSTVGREVAKMLEMDFYDMDLFIQERTGVEIAWIFDKEGEAGFRVRETEALREMIKQSNAIVATGGGAVLSEENRELLRQADKVILLKVGLERQHERAATNQQTRPLLRGDNLKEKLIAMADERTPHYEELAHESFNTDNMHIKLLAKEVANYLRREGF